MISISREDKNFIKNNIVDGQNKLEYAIRTNDFYDLFDSMDDFIIIKGMDKEDRLNDLGREMQKIYDRIYYELY
ncbi:MAG: hypothetical protein Q4B52_08175 [Tissierellia bacterium]|nr:hypothetical protein [Tissierellia bacterium]